MRYRELIELYKKNELDEMQKRQVETDIEKHEAISEYLFDQEDIHLPDAVSDRYQSDAAAATRGQTGIRVPCLNGNKESEFAKMVSWKIKFTFIKLGVCVTMVTLAAVLFVIFFLPKVVDRFYYDPGASNEAYGNQISLDYCVYTELCMPGYNRDHVSVQRRGYGVYDIMILQNMTYNSNITNLAGRIERGKLTLYDPNVLQHPAVNVFAWYQLEADRGDSLSDLIEKEGRVNHCSAGSAQNAAKALEKLDENEIYTAYVSLDRMMTYGEFMRFLSGLNEEKQLESVWCAVCTKDPKKYPNLDNLGFQCKFSSSHTLEWDNETYPQLVLWNQDSLNDGLDVSIEEGIQNEDLMKTHFTSMLRYMADQEKFLKMQENLGIQAAQKFRNAADHVEENGLLIYGFAGIGNKDILLGLNQEKEVYEIYTQKLR